VWFDAHVASFDADTATLVSRVSGRRSSKHGEIGRMTAENDAVAYAVWRSTVRLAQFEAFNADTATLVSRVSGRCSLKHGEIGRMTAENDAVAYAVWRSTVRLAHFAFDVDHGVHVALRDVHRGGDFWKA